MPSPAGVYDPPTRCTGGPTPGALALRDRVLGLFPGSRDSGIYECRTTRTGESLSEHAEGRAVDVGVGNTRLGAAVAAWAYQYAPQLGIQTIIWNDRVWTSRNPTWRPYNDPKTGRPFTDPTLGHRDHVHIGLTRAAGGGLTGAALAAAGNTVNGTLAGVGTTVAGFGGDLVGSAVQPFIDGLARITLKGLILVAGTGLVVAGAYRAVTGRSLRHDTTKLAIEAGEAVATDGASLEAQAGTKAASGAGKAAGGKAAGGAASTPRKAPA